MTGFVDLLEYIRNHTFLNIGHLTLQANIWCRAKRHFNKIKLELKTIF